MGVKKGTEVATIDVELVTIKTKDGEELGISTSNKVTAEVQTETQDAIKLVVKGRLIAQKGAVVTLTGVNLTLTDNVFNVQLAKILQGGTIEKDTDGNVTSYTPPVAGSDEKGEVFETYLYSAIYNAAGIITGYERTAYPNCHGQPFANGAENNVFRVSEYTIVSAPDTGQAPYKVEYIKPDELPVFDTETTPGGGTE